MKLRGAKRAEVIEDRLRYGNDVKCERSVNVVYGVYGCVV